MNIMTDYTVTVTDNGTELWHYADGEKQYWLNDMLHCVNGPAVDHPDGRKEWWVNGIRHRTDGPAIVRPNGTVAWYLNGEKKATIAQFRAAACLEVAIVAGRK